MDGQNFGQNEQPVYQQQPQTGMPENKIHGLSIAGFIVGIIALISSCILSWISAIIGLVGLILAIVGQSKNKSGLGVAGIVISAVAIVAGVVFFIVYGIVLVGAANALVGYYG